MAIQAEIEIIKNGEHDFEFTIITANLKIELRENHNYSTKGNAERAAIKIAEKLVGDDWVSGYFPEDRRAR